MRAKGVTPPTTVVGRRPAAKKDAEFNRRGATGEPLGTVRFEHKPMSDFPRAEFPAAAANHRLQFTPTG